MILHSDEPPEPYPAQLGQPEAEECGNGAIPYKAEPMDGQKTVLVPVLMTMNKYLFDNYRLPMYSYMNRLLRKGTLSEIVGARVFKSHHQSGNLVVPACFLLAYRPDEFLRRCTGGTEAGYAGRCTALEGFPRSLVLLQGGIRVQQHRMPDRNGRPEKGTDSTCWIHTWFHTTIISASTRLQRTSG